MSTKSLWGAGLLFAMLAMTNTGCFWITKIGPNLGAFSIPIPVSPYFQDAQEQDSGYMRNTKGPDPRPDPPGAPCVGRRYAERRRSDAVAWNGSGPVARRHSVALGAAAEQRADREG